MLYLGISDLISNKRLKEICSSLSNHLYGMGQYGINFQFFVYLSCLLNFVPTDSNNFPDWLVKKVTQPTELKKLPNGHLRLTNGLISRDFVLDHDFATIDFFSNEKQSSLLRAINPEAVISLDGITYPVGGLNTSIPRAYLNRTALAVDMKVNQKAFHFVKYKTGRPEAPFPYTPKRGAPKDIAWPPKGLRLNVLFRAPAWAPAYHKNITVTVHYEMYDGIPLMSKWVTVTTDPKAAGKVVLGIHSVEYLAVNWQWAQNGYQWLHVDTDRAHGTKVNWMTDPAKPKMPGSFQQVVNCSYSLVPYLPIQTKFSSFRVHELVIGSSDPERAGLAKRKMTRILAPHTQENPIFFHLVSSNATKVYEVLDQMAEVGFELFVFSFGSGFNYEANNTEYISEIASLVSYANARGIEVGGYDLIALTRTVKVEWMAVGAMPPSACFASSWYDFLRERIFNFMDKTGMSMIATDGPYGGYPCHSTDHSHHRGYQDSIYMQDLLQGEFYTELRKRQVYINQPDNYFYQGGSKTGMGYNEHQYSLPRWQDLSISRQGMYDDTYYYTPTIGWMFLPIVDYHGGGAAAAFDPLSAHKVEYNWALAQYLGAGVAACYRGDHLYDSEETKAIVKSWVSFYRKYRDILTSDIIHVHRADMQGIDCFMHANPHLLNKGLALIFNPTQMVQATNLTLPLYYTGIEHMALVAQEGINFKSYPLDRTYNIYVYIQLQPLQITWLLIQGK